MSIIQGKELAGRIGIDIGGTKIEIMATTTEGEEVIRKREPVQKNYQMMLDQIKYLTDEAEVLLEGQASVGVCVPGAVDPLTKYIYASRPWITQTYMESDLREILRRPVKVANDANCFVLSEVRDGALTGYYNVMGVISGTGFGCGIIIDGKIYQGRRGMAGEPGHTSLPWITKEELEEDKESCTICNKVGCLDMWATGQGVELAHERMFGERLTAKVIAALADSQGGNYAVTIDLYKDRLARAMSTLISIIDPEAIVLGGGMSDIKGLSDGLADKINKYTMIDTSDLPIHKSIHGSSSGVRGAMYLFD